MLLLKARFTQSNRAGISSVHVAFRATCALFQAAIAARNADALCEFGGHVPRMAYIRCTSGAFRPLHSL
jgi:hypothetical protein